MTLRCGPLQSALALAGLLALRCPAAATPPPLFTEVEETAAALRDRALESRLAYDLLRSLTTETGPRFAGTAGDRAAVAWALRQMEALGFSAVRAEPVTVPRWVRGAAEGAILEPFPQELILTALGGSIGTPEEGIAAEVLSVAALEELEALPADAARGKIVFINRRTERHRSGKGYGGTVPIRRDGAGLAARKGALAVLIRSVGTGNHRFPHTGSLRYPEGVRPIPAAALAVPDADLLERQLATGRAVRVRLKLECRYLSETESANVIGEVPGRESPEEIVLLGAHLDSWDLGSGAMDDGAGCAIVMAAARLIADLPAAPRRTLRVVLFANEEFGLSGARAYAEAHEEELERHRLALESDLGGDRVWRFATRVDPGALTAVQRIVPVLEPLGVEWHGNEARGGADLIPLRAARVPFADLTQDASRYFDLHHTVDDTFDKVDPDALAQNVAAYAAVAYWAAETRDDLGRAPATD